MTRVRAGAVTGLATRPWSAGRRLLGRTPLQVKLIAATLALVTVTLALISLASITALRGYLVDRLDDQLQTVAQRPDRPPPDRERRRAPPPGPPSAFLVQYRDAAGRLYQENSDNLLDDTEHRPQVPADAAGWRRMPAPRSPSRPPGATDAGGSSSNRSPTLPAGAGSPRPAWTGSTAPSGAWGGST